MDVMRADCHVHTNFSDGGASPLEMVRAAEGAGLDVVVITDHLTLPPSMDPTCECSVAEDALGAMVAAVGEAAATTPVEVILGAECDWYPGCEGNVERWGGWADVRLGSVHWVDHGWIDDPSDLSLWEELGPDGVWRGYVEAWCAACESPLGFDSMAHPDLPRRFEGRGLVPTMDVGPLLDTMAECARDTGRRVEVSSAAWRKGLVEPYPTAELLGRFLRAGVPITIGSDAHGISEVGMGLERCRAFAWEVGYRHQEVPREGGIWESMPLR